MLSNKIVRKVGNGCKSGLAVDKRYVRADKKWLEYCEIGSRKMLIKTRNELTMKVARIVDNILKLLARVRLLL